jgi:hypothetical protein
MRLVLIYRFLMAFCSLMLFAGALSAQDDETANTIDSLIAAPKILDETVSDEEVYDDDGENMPTH